jgi:hypothetical protein
VRRPATDQLTPVWLSQIVLLIPRPHRARWNQQIERLGNANRLALIKFDPRAKRECCLDGGRCARCAAAGAGLLPQKRRQCSSLLGLKLRFAPVGEHELLVVGADARGAVSGASWRRSVQSRTHPVRVRVVT